MTLAPFHWWTSWSGTDGPELGAQQDALVTVEKAVYRNHLTYNDYSTAALSNHKSLQFWFRLPPSAPIPPALRQA